jgi:shikimate dehydrogenase
VRLALLGHPVSHSLSPAMMAAALQQAGIDARYDAIDFDPPLQAAHLERLHREGLLGANVTVPHKEQALALALESSATARAIGAANVLVRIEGGWRADNSDGPGFLDWLNAVDAAQARVQRAVVLGAGGSARAVVWALLEAGASRVGITARSPEKAHRLAAGFGGHVEVLDLAPESVEDALLVNCTPLGMSAGDRLPVELGILERAGAVLDLVYPASRLVEEAKRLGIPAENGLALLIAQGARAFLWWTGIEPDRKIMLHAAQAEASRRASLRATGDSPPGQLPK